MSAETYVITSQHSLKRLVAWLGTLDFRKPWKVTVELLEHSRARVDQEAVLRGKEAKIAKFTGHSPAEIHEEMLKLHYGTEEVKLGKNVIERPLRRTRTGPKPLKPSEMQDHLRFVEAFAATELGLTV